jgi:hypothetical protein
MSDPTPNPRFQLCQTTVRMPQSLVDWLDQQAREQFCSRGAIIRRALAQGLRRLEEASRASRNDLTSS